MPEEDAASGAESSAEPAPASAPRTSVLFCGSTEWDLMGRNGLPARAKELGMSEAGEQLLAPALIPSLEDKSVIKLAPGPVSCHVLAITSAGTCYAWGRNEQGQLGLADVRRRNCPTLVDSISAHKVVDAALGRNHTLVLTEDGDVFACGSNKSGQLGNGKVSAEPAPDMRKVDIAALGGAKPVRVGAGAEFSMIVTDDGNVFSCGHPEYGQLGHGSENKYIEGRKEAFNYETALRRIDAFAKKGVKIKEIACGVNSTAALDSEGGVWTWGWGSYGRLGHKTNKDELVPRQVDKLSKVTSVYAGSKFHFATTAYKQTYFWGQTKMSGEATTYPKALHDLSGWQVRSLTCGATSAMLCAGESVVAWGPSPTCGELGFGDGELRRGAVVKSSPKPKLVDAMEGATTLDVRLGLSFSVLVVARGDDAGDAVLEKLATLEEEDAAPAESGKGGGAGAGEKKAAPGKKRAAPAAKAKPAAKSKARRRK